jgi:outer membrane protein
MHCLKALLPIAAVCTLAAEDAATPRLAVFVPDQLIQHSVRGKQLFAELEVTKKNLEERLRTKSEEGQKLNAQLQSPSISESGREQIQKQLRDLDFEFKKMQDDSNQEYQRLQQKVFGQFQQEVGPIVEGLAKEQKLQLVLQYQQGLVAYGEEGWMLAFTNEVAKRYDAKFASTVNAAPNAAPKAAPKATPTKSDKTKK